MKLLALQLHQATIIRRALSMTTARPSRSAKTAAISAISIISKVIIRPLTASLRTSKTTSTNGISKKKDKISSPKQKDIVLKETLAEEQHQSSLQVVTKVEEQSDATKTALSVPEVVGISYSSGDITDETPPPPDRRLVNSNATNAPIEPTTNSLQTANTGPVVATTIDTNDPSIATASEYLKKAIEHITKVDPSLKPICTKHFCHVFSDAGLQEVVDPFRSLVSGIISQQVSGAAARAIKHKFIALFNLDADGSGTGQEQFPTPRQCLDTPVVTLRTAGLSQRKAEYVHALAEKFESGELSTEVLLTGTDEELIEKLVAVRGIGRWSAEVNFYMPTRPIPPLPFFILLLLVLLPSSSSSFTVSAVIYNREFITSNYFEN